MNGRAQVLAIGVGLLLRTLPAWPQSAVPTPGPEIDAALGVLDRLRGSWQVTVKSRQPKAADVTYVQTNEWVLGHRFIRGDTGRKSDQTQDISMLTYDAAAGGYPLWIFSSSGVVLFLAPGKWDEARRTMRWTNPPFVALSYRLDCDYSDPTRHRCTSVVKNMVGKVVLDQETVAVRRP
jgi:hypothetical protein